MLRYFDFRVRSTGVRLKLGRRVDAQTLAAAGYDEVIVATGVVPRTPRIPGHEHPMVLSYIDVLRHRKPVGKRARISDPLQGGIEDEMAAVRDESMAGLVAAQRDRAGAARCHGRGFDRALRRGEAERHDFDRQRETAERFDPFRGVGDDDHARRGRRHDLLAQQRPAPALDQGQVGGNLVRSSIQLREPRITGPKELASSNAQAINHKIGQTRMF